MTLVDPFIPIKKTPLPGLTNNIPRPKQLLTPVQHAPQHQHLRQRPAIAAAKQPAAAHTAQLKPHTRPSASVPQQQVHASRPAKKRRAKLVNTLRLLVLPLALIGGGLLLQSVLFGQICILAYALFAFIRRVSSRTTFTLAGISFMGILLLMAVKPESPLIGTFAIYAFLLLAVGIACLVREIYNQDKGTARV